MESPATKLNPWMAMLLAVLMLGAGLWLGWHGLDCFNDAGRWWRGRVRDSFVEAQAQVENVWSVRVKSKSSTLGISIRLAARYRVEGAEHRMVDEVEMQYGRDDKGMAAKAAEIRRTQPVVRVFYDPAHHEFAVLKKESLPGVFRATFMGLMGCIIEAMALVLVAMGAVGMATPMRGGDSAPKKIQPEPAVPQVTPPLTGDAKADYYSGALAAHSLGRWEGFWCDVFLMRDSRIVVAHDNSTHHYFQTWSVEDALAGRADIPFDENQQKERESFERRIRQQHG